MECCEAVDRYRSRSRFGGWPYVTSPGFEWVLDELSSRLGGVQADKVTVSQLRNVMAEVEWERWYSQDRRPSRSERDGIRLALLDFFQWVSVETAISSQDTTEIPDVYEFDASLPFTMDEVEALFAACLAAEDVEPGGRGSSMRKQAILLLLLDTGMHRSQLCRLRVADFSYHEGELTITKAGASRGYRVWLGQNTRQALVRHLVSRDLPGGEAPLIADADDIALRVQEIDTLFNRLGVLAGVKDADPHRLRRTFAREYLRQGGDVYSLQNIFGYPNLREVLWELELSDAAIAREHRKASPGNRLG